jgi:hypothetical protein
MKFAVGKEGIVRTWSWHAVLIGFMGLTNVLPDYVSLLGTRYFLFLTSRAKTGTMVAAFVIGDMIVSLVIAFGPSYAVYTLLFADLERAVTLGVESHRLEHVWLMANGTTVGFSKSEVQAIDQYIVAKTQRRDADHNGLLHRISWEFGLREVVLGVAIPCCLTSIWLWLYALSGFTLKAARRFDIGFEWFNRKFDIERKPLQSIGLVAGALVAIVYWTAAIVNRVVG